MIEPIAESKDKKEMYEESAYGKGKWKRSWGWDVDEKEVDKGENKLGMRCFYQSHPTTRGYRKRMVAIWREIWTFEITEQRLVDQARVLRKNEWLTEVELEEIRKNIWHP